MNPDKATILQVGFESRALQDSITVLNQLLNPIRLAAWKTCQLFVFIHVHRIRSWC